ncbi:MAG: LPXTG cell wall anchor domain-containing protein, partial [Solirubrobacterales bacterium]|nr:LPXTG cell wall anchor domain-containing protein [Solirubrobacterales bacterium]
WVGTGSKAPVIPFVILGLAILAAAGFWIARRRRSGGPDDDQAGGGSDGNPGDPESRSGEAKEAW